MRSGEITMCIALGVTLLAGCSSAPGAERPSSTPPVTSSPTPRPTGTLAPAIRYVAIGASDTVGVGAADPAHGSWPARIAARLPAGSLFVNLGVSGSITLQARSEQLPGAIAQRPTIVSIWLAVNDLNATIDPRSYADSLGEIVNTLVQRTDATIFVGNVPDLRAVPVYASADKQALLRGITAYNDAISAIAARSPARVVVVDLFTGSAELVSTAVVAQDGFHPSDTGYELIAERFSTAMRARGVPLS
ncbi:MAG TPA: GDSL-type esterase/lipase family protein [Candidatus Limnocylindria bacterium]|jgi:lysophospholipase L1-like esterase|nr:GDSL-type esterase/lipase family protein [Candidatus Limnocylindria bacterium]